jgi:hypothetical protein
VQVLDRQKILETAEGGRTGPGGHQGGPGPGPGGLAGAQRDRVSKAINLYTLLSVSTVMMSPPQENMLQVIQRFKRKPPNKLKPLGPCYSTVHSTNLPPVQYSAQCTVQQSAQYSTASRAQYSKVYSAQYSTQYSRVHDSTAQCTVQNSTQYSRVHSTVHSTAQCPPGLALPTDGLDRRPSLLLSAGLKKL